MMRLNQTGQPNNVGLVYKSQVNNNIGKVQTFNRDTYGVVKSTPKQDLEDMDGEGFGEIIK